MPFIQTRGAASALAYGSRLAPTAPISKYALLMHFDGANGSQTFIDESGALITRNGSVVLSDSNFKFGTASGLFSGGYLTTPSTPALTFDNGDLTIDFWVRPGAVSGVQEMITKGSGLQIYLNGATLSVALSNTNSAANYFINAAVGAIAASVWTHIALVRFGNVYSVYVNGVRQYTTTSTLSMNTGASDFVIGAFDVGLYPYSGYMDELRVVNGTAMFTGASFPVPTAPYS